MVLRFIAVLVVAMVAVTACGSDPEGSGSSDEGDCVEGESVTTESGLVIEDLECGDGDEARRGMTAVVHYQGTFDNGEQFDSSYDRDEPFPFTLGSGMVIPGWDEGIVGMREGGVRKLTIPPDLAYGESGQGEIPPNATLIFEVELLEVRER